jgi:hypothetical protein
LLVLLVVIAATAATLAREAWVLAGLLLAGILVTLALPERTAMVLAIELVLLPIALLVAFGRHTGRES